jgi:hypothetical protein
MAKRGTSDRPSLIYGTAEKVSFELFAIRESTCYEGNPWRAIISSCSQK